MCKIILAIVLALSFVTMPGRGQAGPNEFSLLIGSRHLGATGFEEFNPGGWLTWRRDKVGWSIGAYRNSYGRLTVAAAADVPLISWRDGALSAFGGVAHYPGDGRTSRLHLGGDFIPMAGVIVRQGRGFVQVIPGDGNPVDVLISYGLRFEID